MKILASVVALALLLVAPAAHAATVADRCNNPCSIKCSDGQCWLGQCGIDKRSRMVKFASVKYGVRAAAVTLRTYSRKHKVCTVNGILKRYCPGASPKYRQFIANRLRVKPGQKINVEKRMAELLSAIAIYESGKALPESVLRPYR